ncbi:hypothetical protein Tco_0884639 [Tanacetum coccineum]
MAVVEVPHTLDHKDGQLNAAPVSTPTGGIRGDIGINTFRNALMAHYLPHSSLYVSPPSITIVRPWFATIGEKICGLDQISNKDATILYCLANGVKVDYAKLIWEDIIHKLTKKSWENVVPYPRFISLLLEYMMPEYDNEELTRNPTQVFSVHNWGLKPNQNEGPPFTDHMKAICNLDVHVDSKAPKPSSQTKEVPQGKKPGAKSGLKRKQSSKHTSESKTEASKSKTGQSEKETQSSLAKDKSTSHPSPPTPVVGEMHKEAQQAAADSTTEADLGLYAPNDSTPAQQDQTKSAGDGLKTAHTDLDKNEESRADDISKKIKMEDLSDLLKDTRSAFFTLDSPQDEPIIILDESEEEEEVAKDKDTHASSYGEKAKAKVASLKARPSYPDINQLTDLLELPSKFTELSREIKELKKHVQDMEIKLPGDLKEIPTKLETFTSTISSLSSWVAELKNIQWELLADFQALPSQVSSVQEKLQTLDSLPSLLNKVTDTLNRFATVVENASGATTKGVPSTGQATASPVEGEKNTNPAIMDVEPNLHDELVDLLGIDVVTQYYNKNLLYDKYCDKMLKRRKSTKITNCDILTQKGPISLKVHMEDGTSEVISNVKVSDLHLAEWKEVVQACPDRKEKGCKTIYGLIKTRMEYLDQTEKELIINFNKPLKEQDPLNELNDLTNTKRKRTSDSTDHSRSTKKHKSLVQHEEEFESLKFLQRQLFRSLKDWEVSPLQFMQRNYGVTCEDKAKRRNSRTKTKTFEEICYLLLYAISSKEDMAYLR